MPDLIHSKLDTVRRLLLRCLWGSGVAALIAVLCAAFLVGAWLDEWIVGDSRSGRIVLTVVILGLLIEVVRRELVRPLGANLSDAWLARKVEHCYPQLRGALASSIEFLAGRYSASLGSPELQRKSVLAAVPDIHAIDPARVIDTRPARRRAVVAAMLLGICLVWTVLNPPRVWSSLRRLCLPLADIALPRDVDLRLIDPHDDRELTSADFEGRQFPRGMEWELKVVNLNGSLPEDLRWLQRDASGNVVTESIPRSADDAGGEWGVLRLEMREPFAFRPVGGDDDTHPWYEVDVVPPPALQELKLELHLPDYTAEEPRTIPAGVNFVQAVVGSALHIRGKSESPLSSVRLTTGRNVVRRLGVDEDGHNFSGELPIEEPGARFLSLVLVDQAGVANAAAARLEILGVEDRPPAVKFKSPASDLYLTPDAELPLAIEAKDDFGLTKVELSFLGGDADPAGPKRIQTLLAEPADPPARTFHHESAVVFSKLGYAAGDKALMRLAGQDFLTEDDQHRGIDEREVTFITPGEKQRELAGRLDETLERLQREQRAQARLRESIAEETQSPDNGQNGERLAEFVREQKRIERTLTDSQQGLLGDLQTLIDEAEMNRLDAPVFQKRLELLRDDLRVLDQRLFPSISQFLSRLGSLPESPSELKPEDLPELSDPVDPAELQKQLENSGDPDAVLAGLTADRQRKIEDMLRIMSGTLDEWNEDQSLKDQLGEIRDRQKKLTKESARLKQSTLGKTVPQLSPDERRSLADLKDRQNDLQQQLGRFRQALDRQAAHEDAADAVRDLRSEVEESQAPANMDELGRELQSNRLAHAEQLSQELEREFSQWDDLLNDRPITDAELKLQFLKEQMRHLDALRQRQQREREDLEQADSNKTLENERSELSDRQQRIADDAGRIERALRRIEVPQPADTLKSARRELNSAANQIERKPDVPDQTLDRADQRLEQAQRELHQQEQQLQQQHMRQLVSQLVPELVRIRRRQAGVLAASTALLERQKTESRWTRPLLRDLADRKKDQQDILDELQKTAEPIRPVESLNLALTGLTRGMTRSVDSLAARHLDESVAEHQPQVLQRLDILIAVMKRSADNKPGSDSGEQSPGEAGGQDQAPEDQRDVGLELTVLRAVQEQIQTRMRSLAAQQEKSGLSDSLKKEWTDLDNEESQLLDILTEMFRERGLQRP